MNDDTPFEDVCPKCGFGTVNKEVCDSCGALLSRLRGREFMEAEASQDPRAFYAPPLDADEPQPRPWFTIIAILVLLGAIGAGTYYIKVSNAAKEQAAAEKAAEIDAPPPADAGTPAVPATEVETPAEPEITKTPPPQPRMPVEMVPVPQTTKATPEVSAKALDWLSNLKPADSSKVVAPAVSPSPAVTTTNELPPTATPKVAPGTQADRGARRKETPRKSINIGEEVFADRGTPDNQANNIIEKLQANNPIPATAAASPTPPPQSEAASIVAVNAGNFSDEVLGLSDTPVLVLFWSETSDASKAIMPGFGTLSQELAGKVKFAHVQIEGGRELVVKCKIETAPTFLVYKRGREVDRRVGVLPPDVLKAALEPHVKK